MIQGDLFGGVEEATSNENDFQIFWAIYPKKKAKADAQKAWKQIEKDRPEIGSLLDALAAHCLQESWIKSNGAFVPFPATWLRGHRWLDEIDRPTQQTDRQARVNNYAAEARDEPASRERDITGESTRLE